jgi:tetratricopeptide (TPR) repeat protein
MAVLVFRQQPCLGKGGGLSAPQISREEVSSMTTQDSLPDPEDKVVSPCHDPSHAHLTEQEDQAHRLTHQGIDATEQGRLLEAQAIFAQMRDLAHTHALPQWEAQALFGHGVTLDRAGQYTEANPWFEQALALFREHGPPRMELTVSIFLANMLTKTDDPARALPILQQAKRQADKGLQTGDLPADEHEYALYGLYRELGRAYLGLGRVRDAHSMYQQALALDPLYAGARETSALYQDILLLYMQQGDLEQALSFGEDLLETLSPSSAHDLQILADVTFQLGLLCLQTHHYRTAIRYSQLAFQYTQQQQVKKAQRAYTPETLAFLGRTCVNIGSSYGGIANRFSHYATILAYWRCGETLLQQVEAEDVVVPQDNIAGLRRLCSQQMGENAFEQVWQASEPLYQELQAVLVSPDEARGPLLSELMQAASSPRRSKPR